jgi:trk system potassium uptake protein TrkA
MGCEVIAIDLNEQRVNDVRDDVQRALIGDARDYDMIAGAISNRVDEVVVGLGETSIEPSILCIVNLKRLGVKRIVSTARNDDHAMILKAVGADEVIFPERETAERAARRVANPEIRDMFALAGDFRILEVEAPRGLHGVTLAAANLRSKYDLLVLAVREGPSGEFKFLPDPNAVILPGQTLMVMGRELDLARFTAGLN